MGLRALSGEELAARIEERFPGVVTNVAPTSVAVESRSIAAVLRHLKEAPGLQFEYLNSLTAVDFLEYFEVVYHLTSMSLRQTATVKTRAYGRENPSVPSVSHVWKGAEFQEREVYDLMGVRFEGHPDLRRIALWEGFPGHPLRKDFL